MHPTGSPGCASGRSAASLAAVLVLVLLATGCSYHPESRVITDGEDFIEGSDSLRSADVWPRIAALKDSIALCYGNAELHRQLAVLYRLAGTPRSRLLSEEEIDRAISLDPANPMYHVERGLTLVARRYIGEAQAEFNRALELDKTCADAYYQLGRLEHAEFLKTLCFPEHISKAIEYYERALRYRARDENALVNVGFLYSLRKMFNTGKKFAMKAVIQNPKNVRAHLLLGLTLYELGGFDRSNQEFAKAFMLMTEGELAPYRSIAQLLSGDERELYESSTSAKCDDWNRRFWLENDPTPSTEINERQLAHFVRVFLANEILTDARSGRRGAETDRGKTLIRFGMPDKTLYDLGSGTFGGWLSWVYEEGGRSFQLFFNDEFLNGDYHFPISDRIGETSVMMLNAIPPRYHFPISFGTVPMALGTAISRGGTEQTRLAFAVALADSAITRTETPWNCLVTFFDQDMSRFSHHRFTFSPDTLRTIERLNDRFRVLSFWLELLPRELESSCVVEITNDKLDLRGMRRTQVELRNLFGRSLKLSSVRLLVAAEDGSCSDVLDPLPIYRAGGRLCLSYEIYNLKRASEGRARYRITYAIKAAEAAPGDTPSSIRKTLSFMWADIKGGGAADEHPSIYSQFEQSTSDATAFDTLQIDLGRLEPGRYDLFLEVEDLTSGETALESAQFTVTE